MRLEFLLPLRTVPGLNAREFWATRARRVARERSQTELLSKLAVKQLRNLEAMKKEAWYPLTITLIRVKPRGMPLDGDNLQGAIKHCRDGLADALGINDGDENAATWRYGQEKGRWGVRVIIETSDEKKSNVVD